MAPKRNLHSQSADSFTCTSKEIARSLRICIIGAGMAGLGTALALRRAGFQHIDIYEKAKTISELGAGIQVAPNMSRILRHLGVLEDVRPYAVALSGCSLRRWQDNRVLGQPPIMPQAEQTYGSPSWVVHRADLQSVLLNAVKQHKIPVHTGKGVRDIHFAKSSVTLADGEIVKADVILAGDGIKSTIRHKMMALRNTKDGTYPTGDCAFRVIIPRKDMETHPELLEMLDSSLGIRWMGPNQHIMAYPLRRHEIYNVVLLRPDTETSTESWLTKGDKQLLIESFRNWCEPVRKLVSVVNEDALMESRLMGHNTLPTWVEGTTALIGDACHSMLPYVAQGAAQAMEDGMVVAVLLSSIVDKSQVHAALALYQTLRKERAEKIQSSASDTRDALHMHDGPEQEARDMRFAVKPGDKETNPDKWSDHSWQSFMWGTDVAQDTLDLVAKTKPFVLQPDCSLNSKFRPASLFTKDPPSSSDEPGSPMSDESSGNSPATHTRLFFSWNSRRNPSPYLSAAYHTTPSETLVAKADSANQPLSRQTVYESLRRSLRGVYQGVFTRF